MWFQFDWGEGPVIDGRPHAAVVRLARLVPVPGGHPDLGPDAGRPDRLPRRDPAPVGGAPTYALTDNERTVTIDRVAGIAVRHPRSSPPPATTASTSTPACRPTRSPRAARRARSRSPRPTWSRPSANLLEAYPSFAELEDACAAFCAEVNERVHRETRRPPASCSRGAPPAPLLPAEPYTVALGETRVVDDESTVRLGSVRYSVPRELVGSGSGCGSTATSS